jgi:type I restriction enzyme S subunit
MMVQETYKTTWLANAPEHWNTLRIKNIFAEIDDRSETGKEELLSVSHYTGVTKKRDRLANEDDFISNAKTLVGYKKVAENDLISNIMLAWNGSLGISKYNGITSPAYCVYRIKGDNNPDYYGYLFSTAFMKAEFRKKSYGIIDSRLRLYSDKFFSIPAPVPTKTEQDQIVTYIKEQSLKIKYFIKKKKTFIDLLLEQKQSVSFERIHHNGVKFGYPQRRIKSFAEILRGKFSHRPRNDKRLYDGIYPFIQTGDVSRANKYIESYKQTLNDWGFSVSKEFPKGTLCLTIAANVGDVAILNFDACFPDSILGIVPNSEVDLDYLYYALKSYKAKFISESTLTTQYNLNIEKVGPIKISLPSIEEQKKVVKTIKTETAKVDQAITQAQKEIELIKEYKEAMIAEAVLGKFNYKIVKS